ncbi:MAG: exo-alpha-sialidase [Rhodospirillales bacterium]|nr:exo-alpha-sialidase [Rhodospirillales bacterium]
MKRLLVTLTAALGLATALPLAAQTIPAAELSHVHGLAADPLDQGGLLVATHHGLWRLGSKGVAAPVSVSRDDFMGFVAHPTDRKIFYASGHPARGGNLGFIASTDGGQNWTAISPGLDGPVDFHQMDVSKADPQVIYGVHGTIQRSADGGKSWRASGRPPKGIIALAASASDPNRLYAGTEEGLVRSNDGGATWQAAHLMRRPATLVHTTKSGQLYAFVVGTGLIVADEANMTWKLVNADFADRVLLHLAHDPAQPQRLFAYDNKRRFLHSDDGGRSWKEMGK